MNTQDDAVAVVMSRIDESLFGLEVAGEGESDDWRAAFNIARHIQGKLVEYNVDIPRFGTAFIPLVQRHASHWGWPPESLVPGFEAIWEDVKCPEGFDAVTLAVVKAWRLESRPAIVGEFPNAETKNHAEILAEAARMLSDQNDYGLVYFSLRKLEEVFRRCKIRRNKTYWGQIVRYLERYQVLVMMEASTTRWAARFQYIPVEERSYEPEDRGSEDLKIKGSEDQTCRQVEPRAVQGGTDEQKLHRNTVKEREERISRMRDAAAEFQRALNRKQLTHGDFQVHIVRLFAETITSSEPTDIDLRRLEGAWSELRSRTDPRDAYATFGRLVVDVVQEGGACDDVYRRATTSIPVPRAQRY